MNHLFDNFVEQLAATSFLEWLAVILAILYLVLAIKESLWCWVSAFFSTAIYVYLFFDIHLFMESLLNIYYLVMAVYGWTQWQKAEGQEERPVVSWPLKRHFIGLMLCCFLIFVSYFLLSRYTSQSYPLLDSTTTWLAVFATYMVTQKVLENWLYWIVIDLLSVYLYLQKGMALTAILFIAYVILAVVGWYRWKAHFDQLKLTSTNLKVAKDNN